MLMSAKTEATRAGIHGGHEHELTGEGHCGGGPGNGDVAVFQGLAEHFQDVPMELGEFIEEQHAAMGEADLAGHGVRATAEQAGVGNGVVRGAE